MHEVTELACDVPLLLLTRREAAAALRISERLLWTMSEPRGDIPVIQLGRSIRYSVEALQQWIAQQQEHPNPNRSAAGARQKLPAALERNHEHAFYIVH